MKEPELNSVEVWIAEHSIRLLLLAGALVVIGGFFVAKAVVESNKAASEVTLLKPQVTRVVRAASVCSLDAARRSQESRECAMRMRIALINCRRYSRCRAALLSAITYQLPVRSTAPSSEGVVPQKPSDHGHQQPGPGSPGHGGGKDDHGQGGAPAPSPGPSPAPGGSAAPEGKSPAETPGNSAQGGSTSGAAVEVCALERTCVGVEVGVDPKGLTP